MKYIEKSGLRILEADEGFKIYNKNEVNPVYSDTIYLGKKDSPENYKEIPESEIPEETV